MIGRLTAFDLPGRLRRRAPETVVLIATGVALAVVAFMLRAGLHGVVAGVSPFALLFPAVLLATGLAGWRSGFVALLVGALLSWGFLLEGGWSLKPSDLVALGVVMVSGSMVIAAAAAYRATALALRDSQERLDLATAAANVGVWEWRVNTGEVFLSGEARAIFGFGPDQRVTLHTLQAVCHPEDEAQVTAHVERALDPEVRDASPFDCRIVRANGEVRWLQARGRTLFERGADGRTKAVRHVGALQDITARKADEERLRLLAREVDHRANNLLAVVQGTVALSEAEDSRALKLVITGRVGALARAHQLLAQARWEGADLRRLVQEELLAFSLGDEARVSIRGPSVVLAPAAAQSIAMALHELATNAAKYGALSAPGGHVAVSWRRNADRALHISWRETGGPEVIPPTHKGLGTTLLGRALAGPTRGKTTLDWRPEGLACHLIVPGAALEPTGSGRTAEPRSQSAR